ncbi:MAG: hypothetical protein M3377_07850 [Actinomycetota bacterium]|nr:hypothetical protein [Actinomycetota bacterium]
MRVSKDSGSYLFGQSSSSGSPDWLRNEWSAGPLEDDVSPEPAPGGFGALDEAAEQLLRRGLAEPVAL